MICPTCHTEMILRSGKYGKFFYCAAHGTISKRAAELITAHLGEPHKYAGGLNEDPLMSAVKRTSVAMCQPLDNLQQTIDFYVDHPPFTDDEDHWMNTRDY